ncbi:hypothetical protein [Enterococcus termitis]|uniref:Uncharacterized protein n=1 Tax=Enterococcus termitis TaxID=332950 RepID=A0A1E5H4A0_9ENTE|nr:hypothetical protein [Enterococcus termitis]OEG19734.1 hypothetical protein BCR25_14905 [Enterococcus termitis]OJG96777.1 hypothetical protein RV18_GL001912 [Enterococcus termitis]
MSLLDMSFIGLLSSAILFFIFGAALVFFRISTNKQWKKINVRRVKNKKKRKKLQRIRKQLEQKKKRQLVWAILCFVLFFVTAGGAGYSRYYQLTNLTAEDAEAVAKTYYLVGEMKKQVTAVDNGASPEKTVKNLRDLSAQLASASVKPASQGMSVEGQKLLNRHLSLTRQLAVNISNQNQEAMADASIREMYLKDIAKVTESEQKVFKHFKVNESALQQKK